VAAACSAVVLLLFTVVFNDKDDEDEGSTLGTTPLLVSTETVTAVPEAAL
jgi:hypothetical protein